MRLDFCNIDHFFSLEMQLPPRIEPLVALIESRLKLNFSQDQLHVSHCLGLSLVAAAASAHRGCVQVEGVRRQVTNAVQIFTPLPFLVSLPHHPTSILSPLFLLFFYL